MANNHTPTPWHAGRLMITAGTGAVVAHMDSLMNPSTRTAPTFDQIQADAEFIVRAVNVHDDLVAELAHANAIIIEMLNNMTPAGKRKADAALTAAGHSPAGMTRHHERLAVLAKASAI